MGQLLLFQLSHTQGHTPPTPALCPRVEPSTGLAQAALICSSLLFVELPLSLQTLVQMVPHSERSPLTPCLGLGHLRAPLPPKHTSPCHSLDITMSVSVPSFGILYGAGLELVLLRAPESSEA